MPELRCVLPNPTQAPWRKQLYVQLANNHVRSAMDKGVIGEVERAITGVTEKAAARWEMGLGQLSDVNHMAW